MDKNTENEKLIRFWNSVFTLDDEELKNIPAEGWRELAPCQKLFDAAAELGKRKKILDYGCGSGWAGIIAAKSGCLDVTAADAAEEALRSTKQYASIYGVDQIIHTVKADKDRLDHIPDRTFDGLFCSNVLDVIPEGTSVRLIKEFARIIKDDADVFIGMNYYMSEQEAADKGLELIEHKCLYVDGILRMVSKTDEEWIKLFSPYFTLITLDHFAWNGEKTERRRLFHLKKENKK